jgi:hypothetical protein
MPDQQACDVADVTTYARERACHGEAEPALYAGNDSFQSP